jgi:hypothetical protein
MTVSSKVTFFQNGLLPFPGLDWCGQINFLLRQKINNVPRDPGLHRTEPGHHDISQCLICSRSQNTEVGLYDTTY